MWQVHQQTAGCLMNVRTNAGKSCRNKELLRVPVKSVIRFSRQPAIETIAVSHQETPCISSTLPDRIPGGIFCVESCSLNADLGPLLRANAPDISSAIRPVMNTAFRFKLPRF